MHGDAGSRYQAVEVRRRRVRSAVLSLGASCHSMLFHESCFFFKDAVSLFRFLSG